MFPVLPLHARRQALAVAVAAALSLAAQWVYLMQYRGTGPVETLIDMSRFFTILTTFLVFVAFVTIALVKKRSLGAPLLAALTLSAVVTGVVYHVMLSAMWNPTGIGLAADWGLHTVVPAAVLLWWLWHAPKTGLIWADLPAFVLWPSVYGAYALGLGTIDGVYPYPFMDPTIAGPWPVAATLATLLGAMLAGGLVMIAIGRFADR
ncbi:Pr6Pr family membrane protein [Roseibacterium sp. SDUM158017]|uniref:Pr6Pr family membrane protein n=1 Tax=Roseicyclus salinarum TaxID=3036773 RepID=UPI002414F3D5|nr:Pr6Pr family membrane protein [Roseibacterium sp. SDUM158017]MDG4649042.1 Pr6Pr family membrane protein [Roseibacterium sp. SDUM158017]